MADRRFTFEETEEEESVSNMKADGQVSLKIPNLWMNEWKSCMYFRDTDTLMIYFTTLVISWLSCGCKTFHAIEQVG